MVQTMRFFHAKNKKEPTMYASTVGFHDKLAIKISGLNSSDNRWCSNLLVPNSRFHPCKRS